MKNEKQQSIVKQMSQEWWDTHPMDYLEYKGVEPFKTDEAAREFFQRIDSIFYKQAYFAHKSGAPLFSRLIDYNGLNGKNVLEVGCGLGAIAAELAKSGARVTAIDFSTTGAITTAERFRINGLQGYILQADAENLPFADKSFDFVWSWGVIHHTPNTEKVISEIYRVLKPNGRMGIMIYHKNSLYNWLNVILRYGILRLQLLKMSQQELWNRYTDGKNLGGCPLAKYYSKKQAQILFKQFDNLSITAFSDKGIITKLVPDILGIRSTLDRIIPEKFFDAVFKLVGFLMFVQGQKPAD